MARNILIVDSSPVMRKIISGMVQANFDDSSVFEADDAVNASLVMERRVVDLILYTWEKYNNEALEFFEDLQRMPKKRKTPFLLLVGSNNPEQLKPAIDIGIINFLVVPCEPCTLTEKISSACNPVRMRADKRYSLPGSTALLEQGVSCFSSSVGNISSGGMLCDFAFNDTFKIEEPVMVTLNFTIGNEEYSATGLYSVLVNYNVADSNDDFTPKNVRLAFRFVNVPPETEIIMSKVFAVAENLEQQMSANLRN
jgi:CheY-like chemotaxis protein